MNYLHSDIHLAAVRKGGLSNKNRHASLELQKIEEYNKNPKSCSNPNCINTLDYKRRNNKYCSNSCSATMSNTGRVRTSESKKKTAISITTYQTINNIKPPSALGRKTGIFKTCPHCGVEFYVSPHKLEKKYCSINGCWKLYVGGKRPGSGSGKKGYYNGLQLDSTYELAYVIYCIDHNINIKRNKQCWSYTFNGKIHKYYPDFLVNGSLVEIKAYKSELTDTKISCVDNPLQVLYTNDLKPIFDYVENKTGLKIKNLYQLYDS